VQFGCAVTEWAKCAIDISDGLLADLGHILAASGVGAEIELSALPVSDDYRALLPFFKDSWQLVLSGGDDYELCITVSPTHCERVEALALQQGIELTRIGSIVSGAGVRCVNDNGEEIAPVSGGFDHFKSADKN
jgi:thiamine-monophosphate kinase